MDGLFLKFILMTHGETLTEYILDFIPKRRGIMFHSLYRLILDNYGEVSGRTIHRRLKHLRLQNRISRLVDSDNETHFYYRLSKTS